MESPNSFCTICTKNTAYELIGMLLTLSLHHINANIYILSDEYCKNIIDRITPKIKLNIKWFIELNEYSDQNRRSMCATNKWSDFLKNKAKIMLKALEKEEDVLFMDSDIIILDKSIVFENNMIANVTI